MARLFGIALLLAVASLSNASVIKFPPESFFERPNVRVLTPREDTVLNYRLPNETQPIHYDVTLSTDVHEGKTEFTGTVVIDLKVIADTKQIVLHTRQLSDFVATIRSKNTATVVEHNLKYETDIDREFLLLSKDDVVFVKDTEWALTISYKGNLRSDNGGFYLSTYIDNDGKDRYLATTQFESTDARHAFPCYDEPAKRATFAITIKHSSTYHAISNMPVDETKSSAGVTAFQTTVIMPTYLVAFIVSDFESSEGKLNGIDQRVFSRKEAADDQEWALTTGMLVEKRLSQYYDVPFALPKLDQAAIPDFAAGAMENWGLATYREEYLLYNTVNSTINTQTNIATIVSHEYAHMWFGDLVSIEWWTYLWLKEGFATLFEHLAVDLAYPEWDIFQTFHFGSYQGALSVDASTTSRPMTHYVQKPSEISLLYDSISYAKAGSVLDMWRNALTNTVFQRGLHNYLTDNQFDSADEWKLFAAIHRAAIEENYAVPETIEKMLSSWTQQAGYPLLTVTRNYDNGSITITQQAYFNNETHKEDKIWHIPFNFADQSNPDFRNTEATHYLSGSQITINDAKLDYNDWLILNKQSTGYYRINYDEENWHLITVGLLQRPHKIHPRNRAQLIDDAYHFSISNRLRHDLLLNMLTYLPKEDQYAPWASANWVLSIINRYLSGDSKYDDFKYFVSEIVTEQFDKFGVNDVKGEQHLVKFTRNVLINLACLAGVESCLTSTSEKLNALIENNTPIEPNLQSQTYCNGLKNATEKQYDFVYEKLMKSNDQAERRLLISALGCSQNSTQIKKFISSSIDLNNELRTQERTTLLSPAYSRGEVGLLASIEFLDENHKDYGLLNSGFGGVNPLYSDLISMSAYVVNENQEQKFLALVNKVKDSEHVEDDLSDIVAANIQANNNWLSTNRDPLMSYLHLFRTGGSASLTASTVSIAMVILFAITKLF